MVHFRCRNRYYPWSDISRLFVADNQVSWYVLWKDYNPPEYNSDNLVNKPWADNQIDENFKPKWNSVDGKINRKSYMGDYQIFKGFPLNPEGRTGMKGRGALGRWGPNHAADPIVTRWKRINGLKQHHPVSHLPILEVCVIQRRDNDTWAFPGGMVDPGEKVSATLKREFMEEAMNSLESKPKQKIDYEAITNFFRIYLAYTVYSGYVDDPRNTDNAWVETAAVNFHDDTGTIVDKFPLEAGDDAQDVKWLEVKRNMDLNITHLKIFEKVLAVRQAHW